MKDRIVYIDYLKAIGIFLVILGHQPLISVVLHRWIFSFHVPLFFFVSGFLMKAGEGNFKPFLWKNLKCLILVTIPYFIFNRLYSTFEYSMFYPDKSNMKDILWDPMSNWLLGTSQMGSMWFLFALFWMRIVYWLITHYICKQEMIICLLALMIGCFFCNYKGELFNYYQLGAAVIAFPFFCMGSMLRSTNERYLLGGGKISVCVGLTFFLVSFVLIRYLGDVNLNDLMIGNSAALYYIVPIINILGLLFITSMFRRREVVENVSSGTLLILGLHGILIQIFKMGYKIVFGITQHPPYMDSLSGVIISIIIIVILYPVITRILKSNRKELLFLLGK